MSHSEQISEIAAALAKAQGQIKNPKRDKTANIKTKTGASYSYSYVDLATVWEAIRKPLADNGLGVTQTEERVLVGDANGTDTFLRTLLVHSSGQWIDSYHPLPDPTKIEPREWASFHTYARRYALSALVGIAPDEDDDADAAQKVEVAPRAPERPPAKVVPLTDAQIEQIRLYTAELDTDKVQKFLTWLNVKSIGDIGQHQYDRAISGLAKAVGRTIGGEQAPRSSSESPEAV